MFDLTQCLQNGVPELPAAALFLFFFFGTFVSEDAACLLAGSAVASGRAGFVFAATACFLGIFAGDVLLFCVGRSLGDKALSCRLVKRFVSDQSAEKARKWLNNNTAAAVFFSRFVTGLRLPTYVAAGALGTGFGKFALFFLIASAIWTPILVGSAAFSQTFFFSQNALIGLVVTAISIRLIVKYSSHRNRRLLIGRIRRIVKWEFWPIQIFYFPVVLYVLTLAVKHRSLTAFTAANPAIAAGGFKGESKNAIYRSLRRSPAAAPFILEHTLIRSDLPTAKRLEHAWRFIDEHQLWFPIAVKPDAGERGKDVSIVHSMSELEAAIISAENDIIIQEFASGPEISVFYYRYPTAEHGQIFSITEKQFPQVIGDGRSTVEDLILDDQRAVCLARKYFDTNREKLDFIPPVGEQYSLIDIGTHSRGAVFLDGGHLRTDEFECRIDAICGGVDGFYFGRFDIRAENLNEMRDGRNFKIIELNGVTSESTNIYDPRYSLIDAYRILFRQWRIAFEIGTENIKLGARRTSILDLMRMTLGARPKNDIVHHCDQTRAAGQPKCA